MEKEKTFQIAAMKSDNEAYELALPELKKLYEQLEDLALARDYFIEIAYRGLDIVSIARTFRADITDLSAGKEFDQAHIDVLRNRVKRFYKDYDKNLDKELFTKLMHKYGTEAPKKFMPDVVENVNGKYKGHYPAFTDMVYGKTIFDNKEEVLELLENYNKALSSRDADKFVDGEQDVVDLQYLINDFSLVRNKYIGIIKALEAKQFQINNVVKLRAAGLEDISL